MFTSERPYTIIEAGYSRYPSVAAYGRRPLLKGQLYIALGRFDSALLLTQTQFWMDILNDPEEDTGIRRVERGEITTMPFGNDTADEIIVPNYFGDPFITNPERALAAKEIVRVLRPGGYFTALETANSGVVTAADLADLLSNFGLHQMNAGHEYDPFAVSQYTDVVPELGYVAAFVLQPQDVS